MGIDFEEHNRLLLQLMFNSKPVDRKERHPPGFRPIDISHYPLDHSWRGNLKGFYVVEPTDSPYLNYFYKG